jgi:serine/threonine protein phosphatase 1
MLVQAIRPEPPLELRDAARILARPTVARVEGQLVYAVGDVHGRYDLLKELMARIAADAAAHARGRRPILIFCGDYVDRGPNSAEVIESLLWLQRNASFDLHLLKGNHEQALLAFLDDPESAIDWISFGGAETLRSYGVTPPRPEAEIADYQRARDKLLDGMPASHLRLMERLELIVGIGDYAFAHAGVRPGVPLERQSEDDLLWIRRGFLDSHSRFEKIVVHGHSWRDSRAEILDHRIGLDTGAYQTGVLTAVRLEDECIEVIHTGC